MPSFAFYFILSIFPHLKNWATFMVFGVKINQFYFHGVSIQSKCTCPWCKFFTHFLLAGVPGRIFYSGQKIGHHSKCLQLHFYFILSIFLNLKKLGHSWFLGSKWPNFISIGLASRANAHVHGVNCPLIFYSPASLCSNFFEAQKLATTLNVFFCIFISF